MTSQNRKLVDNRFQNTRTSQKERGIVCWRLLWACPGCEQMSFTMLVTKLENLKNTNFHFIS